MNLDLHITARKDDPSLIKSIFCSWSQARFTFSMNLNFESYFHLSLRFDAQNAHATSSNWPRFNIAIFES